MSTQEVSIRRLDSDEELSTGQLVHPQLVVASFTPALAGCTRTRAVFADGRAIPADVLLDPGSEPSVVGIDLDEAVDLEPVDLTEFELPMWPGDAPDQVRSAAETLLGRGAATAVPGPPVALFAAAAAGRIRSPFCWLFPRSRACR